MLVELKQKSQVTIPRELVKKLNLKPGDKLEIEEKDGCLIITPVTVIPTNQMWFYSSEWQAEELSSKLKRAKSNLPQARRNCSKAWSWMNYEHLLFQAL